MEVAILQTEDKTNIKLLAELARKLGIQFKVLSEDEKEDIGMGLLIKEADRGEKVSREEIMRKLA